MQHGPRDVVIGLNCATPKLLFDDLRSEVPTIAKLMDNGMYGDLASITPPITVPAWACGMTGQTPGQLGIYGFRNRKDATYDGLSIAHSGSVKEPAVWDALGAKGMRSVLIGVPPSYPPPSEFPGWRVGCFLTPPSADRYAFPQDLEAEIEEELGGKGRYIFDIPNFRTAGFDVTLDQVFKMTERRFQVDYRSLDRELASLIELVPDDAVTIVMSDHGARPMMGGLCFNDWLIQQGYLALEQQVVGGPVPFKDVPIDWTRTVAWGDGGYYGRLFLNVKGREPHGVVAPSRYEATRNELIEKLEAGPGPDGTPLGTKVLKPQDVYPDVRGVAPDLLVYFGDLSWRSVGSIGNPSLFTYENDTGPDGANHDRDGILIMSGAPGQATGKTEGLRLVDVGPTILSLYDIDASEALPGAVGRSFLA